MGVWHGGKVSDRRTARELGKGWGEAVVVVAAFATAIAYLEVVYRSRLLEARLLLAPKPSDCKRR